MPAFDKNREWNTWAIRDHRYPTGCRNAPRKRPHHSPKYPQHGCHPERATQMVLDHLLSEQAFPMWQVCKSDAGLHLILLSQGLLNAPGYMNKSCYLPNKIRLIRTGLPKISLAKQIQWAILPWLPRPQSTTCATMSMTNLRMNLNLESDYLG